MRSRRRSASFSAKARPTTPSASHSLTATASPRVLAHIHRVLKRPEFEDGEAAGLTDAQRSVASGRSAAGLIAHLTGPIASGPADPDAA
jgi:hypothetical protein